MYKVTVINDGHETEIHNPNVNHLKLESGVIKKEINKIDSFSLTFNHDNPAYGLLKPFKTLIKVLNMKTYLYEFEGRVLGPSDRMTDEGAHNSSFDCEGELGYLHDSQQKHMEFRGTPLELFTVILNYHNAQVEEYKQFEVGTVNVTNSTDNLYVYLSAEDDTLEAIYDKLIDRLGGELQIRKENGVRYLDYLVRIGEDKSTEIRLAKNLRSMTRDVDPTEIITRLTPLGTRIESEDEEATDASQARLTIESVNNGTPYLDDEALIEEFGIQGGSITWDDVTLPENLLTSGLNWLANQKVVRAQYEISALDLFLIGLDITNFEVGNAYPVYNPIMGIDETLRIIGKTTDINSPQDAALKIGDKFKTLNEYQNDANQSVRRVNNLEQIVSRQSQTIGSLKTELQQVDQAIQQVKIELEEGDLPALEDAIDSLNQAVDNLIEAIDDIPVYDLATPTTDGLMSATDKTKLNGLKNYVVATETEDGLLSSADKKKLNFIKVTKLVDLDDLLARVEALENGN